MRFPWSSKPRRMRHKPLIQAPFFGRTSELAALEQHLQAAREGATRYAALVGPSGAGKSALLAEFAFMQRATPEVLLVQLQVGDCLLVQEFYVHLFDALRRQSETVLRTLFTETKRLRKALSVAWDETEFRHILTSADWPQLQASTSGRKAGAGARSDPLRQLFTSVRQHPWAVGAATILDTVSREALRKGVREPGVQRWATLLHAMQSQPLPQGAVLVLVLDQLGFRLPAPADAVEQWRHHWRTFVDITREHMMPLLLIWAGTADSLRPVQQAVSDAVPLRLHPVAALEAESYQQLTRRLRRMLPRPVQEPWQRLVTDHAERFRHPGSVILTATWLAAMAEAGNQADDVVLSVVQAEPERLVDDLVDVILQRHPEANGLLQQLLEIGAFLAPGKTFRLEEILPLCDFAALGLDAVSGRVKFETLLGDCVRYGLLSYDVYHERYATTYHLVQDGLQRRVCPATYERHTLAWRRRLTAAVMHHVQRGDRELLSRLARIMEAEDDADGASPLAAYIVPALQRIMAQSRKDERRRMARALGKFRSPLAVDLLMPLLSDPEDTVRSGAAQSLAELDGLETGPALVKACRDRNSDVRWIAASALSRIEGELTVDTLIAMLTDEDKEVSRIAARGLGARGEVRAVPHLIDAVRDHYPLLRESAALALGQIADRRALPVLQELLQDANPQVRRSAEQALARLSASSC